MGYDSNDQIIVGGKLGDVRSYLQDTLDVDSVGADIIIDALRDREQLTWHDQLTDPLVIDYRPVDGWVLHPITGEEWDELVEMGMSARLRPTI